MHVFSIPLRTRFRGITEREGVLIQGPAGWGEWSPFLEYDDDVSRPWLQCALEAAAGDWPAPVRDAVPVNVTVPACSPERAHQIVVAGGCTTAKVKVAERGQTLADDLARLEAVRDAIGPGRTDPGRRQRRLGPRRGGARSQAAGARCGWPGVRRTALRERRGAGRGPQARHVPIAADESIRRAEDPYRVRDLEAADIAVLKVQPLGGVRACLRIAEDIGMPVVVSSAVESSVGIAAGVALAAALPTLEHACGLATIQLLTDDVAVEPLLPVDGFLPVRPVELDEEALARLAAPADRVAHWEGRLRAVRQDLDL